MTSVSFFLNLYQLLPQTLMAVKHNGTNGLFEEITQALKDLDGWGSVEIFVQDGKVTQITRRTIRKINHKLIPPLNNP